jgi:hypothetical protein
MERSGKLQVVTKVPTVSAGVCGISIAPITLLHPMLCTEQHASTMLAPFQCMISVAAGAAGLALAGSQGAGVHADAADAGHC